MLSSGQGKESEKQEGAADCIHSKDTELSVCVCVCAINFMAQLAQSVFMSMLYADYWVSTQFQLERNIPSFGSYLLPLSIFQSEYQHQAFHGRRLVSTTFVLKKSEDVWFTLHPHLY